MDKTKNKTTQWTKKNQLSQVERNNRIQEKKAAQQRINQLNFMRNKMPVEWKKKVGWSRENITEMGFCKNLTEV